jgi:hypothetical protein
VGIKCCKIGSCGRWGMRTNLLACLLAQLLEEKARRPCIFRVPDIQIEIAIPRTNSPLKIKILFPHLSNLFSATTDYLLIIGACLTCVLRSYVPRAGRTDSLLEVLRTSMLRLLPAASTHVCSDSDPINRDYLTVYIVQYWQMLG